MNKKLLLLLSILSLVLSLPLIPANAAVKAGATCKTAGSTSVTAGKTYTCIKSGKKLVWDKGRVIPLKIVKKSNLPLGNREFGGVAMSDDGSRLVVSESCIKRSLSTGKCEVFGNIYTSSDYGLTWLKQESAGSRYWKGVSSSNDGRILHAVSYPGEIYRSEDFGVNWNKLTCCERWWWTIASSGDGKISVAAEYITPKGVIATSIDGGKNWSENLTVGRRNWYKVAVSNDGTKMAAVDTGGFIYTSDDYGANWNASTSAGQKNWWSIDVSDDGQVIVAAAENSNIVVSNDFGTNWNLVSTLTDKRWNSVTISGDGMKIFALGDYGAGLYYSEDSGKTWAKWKQLINPGNGDMTISRNGTKMASIPLKGLLNTYTIR